MIRRLIEWLLHILHIRRRRKVGALQSLTDLIPMLFCTVALVGLFNWLAPFLPDQPWYERVWWSVWYRVQHVRAIIVGY